MHFRLSIGMTESSLVSISARSWFTFTPVLLAGSFLMVGVFFVIGVDSLEGILVKIVLQVFSSFGQAGGRVDIRDTVARHG